MSLDEILEERAEEAREEGKAEGKVETLRRLKMMGLLPEDFELPDGKRITSGVKGMKLGE